MKCSSRLSQIICQLFKDRQLIDRPTHCLYIRRCAADIDGSSPDQHKMSRDGPKRTGQHETFMKSFPEEAVLARIKNNVCEYLEREQHTSARAFYSQRSRAHIRRFAHYCDHLWKCARVP